MNGLFQVYVNSQLSALKKSLELFKQGNGFPKSSKKKTPLYGSWPKTGLSLAELKKLRKALLPLGQKNGICS